MIDFSTVKAIKIPEGSVYKITRNGETLWESSYINMVARSTESDGKTIYNGGLGYKNGYRIRSGGAEAAANSTSCTGFIPVNGGDRVRISGVVFTTAGGVSNAINVSGEGFTNLGQLVGNSPAGGYGIMAEAANKSYTFNSITQSPEGVYNWIVPPDSRITHIRVTGHTPDGANLIVTVNQEIP